MVIIVSVLSACKKKNETARNIDGSWHMLFVEEKATRVKTFKPANSADVILTFASKTDSTGTFTGNTPSNKIHVNEYFLTKYRELKVQTLLMTNAPEAEWGKLFIDNFVNPEKCGFEGDSIIALHSKDGKRIWFKKL